jgi:hypothetical protein
MMARLLLAFLLVIGPPARAWSKADTALKAIEVFAYDAHENTLFPGAGNLNEDTVLMVLVTLTGPDSSVDGRTLSITARQGTEVKATATANAVGSYKNRRFAFQLTGKWDLCTPVHIEAVVTGQKKTSRLSAIHDAACGC